MVSTDVVDLTDVNDDDDDNSGTLLVPKVEVEDIPTEEVNEEHKNAKSAQYGLGHPQYGRGMRTQTKPVLYVPVITGSYNTGFFLFLIPRPY